MIARLAAESRRAEAVEQAKAVAADVRARFGGAPMAVTLTPLDVAVSGAIRLPLLILFTTVAAVFLVAVTSLASLVLARAASRAGEVAVRRSLGASAWRLVRAWLIDGVVLAIPGTLLGASLCSMLLRYGKASLPPWGSCRCLTTRGSYRWPPSRCSSRPRPRCCSRSPRLSPACCGPRRVR